MPRKNIMDAMRKYTDPFRVTKGKDFRLKEFDPGDTLGLKMDKEEAAALLERGSEWLAMEQDILYAQELLVCAARVPSDGCGGEGRDDQARHVAHQSAGLRRLLFQAALGRGTVARFPMALFREGSAARSHRNLQPLLLRGGPGRTRASRAPESAEDAAEPHRQGNLGRAARRYRAVRGLSRAPRRGDS